MGSSIRHVFALAVVGLLIAAAPAAAATYDVNTFSDPVGSGCTGGTCSLRQATDAVGNGVGGGDTINLPAGTYNLTQAFILSVSKPATITGAGAGSTVIDGIPSNTVFGFSGTSAGSILQDVAITGGQSAVTNGVSGLTLRRVWIYGNNSSSTAAGVNSSVGTTLAITDSTISGNTAASTGGGLYNRGSATITNSTFSGNTATSSSGGGIYNDGTMQITNSTITGNTALIGGGIHADTWSTVTVANSIIAGNTATGFGAPANCEVSGTVTSLGGNLENLNTCLFATPTDHPNTASGLGPLLENGGPTKTHALLTGSAAIGGGLAGNCQATDQRGVTRPQLGSCDSGAYEFSPPIVTTGASSSVGANKAVVAGTVGANLLATNYRVEYGKTSAYGASTTSTPLSVLTSAQSVAITLTGLSTSTNYHYRVVATNADGTSNGVDQVFKTKRFSGLALVAKTLKVDSKGRARLRVRCPSGTIGSKCIGVANLFTLKGKLPSKASSVSAVKAKRLGRKKVTVKAGRSTTVKLKLSPATLAKLRTRSKLKLRALLTARDGDKHARTRSYRVTVKG